MNNYSLTNPSLTLTDINVALTLLVKKFGKQKPAVMRLLVGKNQLKQLEAMVYSGPIIEENNAGARVFFGIPIVEVDRENYFEVVYSAEE